MNNFVFLFLIAFCGTCTWSVNVEEINRIHGGSIANDGQFPFMVSLQRIRDLQEATRGHRCGAVLVTLRHALTAASCLLDNLNGQQALNNPNDYRVFAGAASLTNDATPDRVRRVSNFILHPDYNPRLPLVNDIGIIRLAEEFSSNVVRFAPILTNDATPQQGPVCTSSGWGGENETVSASTQLRYMQKAVMLQQSCSALFALPGPNSIAIRDSMICATSMPPTATSCQGDIGNPLVCSSALNGILIHASCASIENFVEVYTRVSSFRSWINNVTSGVSTFQPGMAILAVIAVVQIMTAYVLY